MQVPAVPNLAHYLNKHRPAGLVSVPVLLQSQLFEQGCINGLEQGGNLLQPINNGAWYDAQANVSEFLQKPLCGGAAQVFVEQDHAPDRDAIFAFGDELRWYRGAGDGVRVGAVADLNVVVAMNSAHKGFNFDFDDRAILSRAEFSAGFVAGWADAAFLFAVFVHHGQFGVHGAPVVGLAWLVAFVAFGVGHGA